MPQVTFVQRDLPDLVIVVREGESVLDAALDHDVPGIIGQCGGAATCLTCHCYVQEVTGILQGPTADELEVLEYVYDRKVSSRLACEIRLGAGLLAIAVIAAPRQI